MTPAAMVSYTLPHPDVEIVGASGFERSGSGIRPHRLPHVYFDQIPTSFMKVMVESAAGVRLRFITEATRIELDAFVYAFHFASTMSTPFRPAVDLIVDGHLASSSAVDSGVARLTAADDVAEFHRANHVATVQFPPIRQGVKVVEVWLPHNAVVDLSELRANAPVHTAEPNSKPLWIHHGSSISHSLEATHPTGTWPAIAARKAMLELRDMSFAGNALLDPFVARAIRDTEADLITLKIGVNLVNANSMSMRSFVPAVHGFLDTVRDRHARTPIVVISPIICPAIENVAGPTAIDPVSGQLISLARSAQVDRDELTLGRVRRTLAQLLEERGRKDPHAYYLDGRELLGSTDVSLLHDGLHPDAAGYQLIGERIATFLKDAKLLYAV